MSLLHAWRGGSDGRPGWWLSFDYDEQLVPRLKAQIAASERSWDEVGKRWWISEDAVTQVLLILPALASYLNQPPLFMEGQL